MNTTIFDRLIAWIENNHRWTAWIILILLAIIFFGIPIVVTQVNGFIKFDSTTGVIGDTIGGTTGPLVALLAAILTFFAFWIQYRANRQQQVDLRKERFENKFFEMLRLHKENIAEMNIEGYDINMTRKTEVKYPYAAEKNVETTYEEVPKITAGRKVFVTTATELESCHEICKFTLEKYEIPNKQEYLIKLAYRLFFNGIESEAVKQIDKTLPDDQKYVQECKNELKEARNLHVFSNGAKRAYKVLGGPNTVTMFFKYKPFSGHSARFGHYYRHLFLMVKYVIEHEGILFTYTEVRDYLRMVRAQLSKFEQLMLYFNFLSGYGSKWENSTNAFFSRYRMIHNLPIELTNYTIDPYTIFSDQIEAINNEGQEMFEYDEE